MESEIFFTETVITSPIKNVVACLLLLLKCCFKTICPVGAHTFLSFWNNYPENFPLSK